MASLDDKGLSITAEAFIDAVAVDMSEEKVFKVSWLEGALGDRTILYGKDF